MAESDRDETGFGPVTDPAEDLIHAYGPEPLWNESWYLDWSDGAVGGFTRVGLVPNTMRALYWLHLVTPDGVVALCDHDVALPAWPDRLFLKGASLWVDYECQEPLRHWQLQMEGYGVRVADGRELLDSEFGERVPVAIDLQLEGAGTATYWPRLDPDSSVPSDRYEQPCRYSGEIRVGTHTYDVDAFGERDHSWGERDWCSFPWIWSAAQILDGDGELVLALNPSRVDVPDLDNAFGVTWHDGTSHRVTHFDADISYGPRRWPETATLVVADTSGATYELRGETVDAAVIWFDAEGGRRSRMIRPLVQFSCDLGTGSGFMELNRPLQGPFALDDADR